MTVRRYDQRIEPARGRFESPTLTTHRGESRRTFMYQPCTSTAVNHGEQRSPTVMRKRVVSRSKAALPGTAESFGPGLITRRSQVQILPPPPNKSRSEALSVPAGRASAIAVVNICQRFSAMVVNTPAHLTGIR